MCPVELDWATGLGGRMFGTTFLVVSLGMRGAVLPGVFTFASPSVGSVGSAAEWAVHLGPSLFVGELVVLGPPPAATGLAFKFESCGAFVVGVLRRVGVVVLLEKCVYVIAWVEDGLPCESSL